MTTAHEISRASFADAMRVTTMTNLLRLAEAYAQALTTAEPDQFADVAADLAAVTDEIQYRTRR